MKLVYKIDATDHRSAQWLHLRPRPIFKILGIFVSLLALCSMVVAWIFIDDPGLFGVRIILSVAIIYLALYFIVFLPRKWNKIYLQQKSLQRSNALNIEENGIDYVSENGTGKIAWKDYLCWKENDYIILLYFSEVMFQIIPKRAFSSQEEQNRFVKLLNEKIGSAST